MVGTKLYIGKRNNLSILPLVTAFTDFKALTTPCNRFVFDNFTPDETAAIAQNIVESMYHHNGLGISGNQLGMPWRIFAMRGPESDYVCFNPIIVMPSTERVKMEEGCLSFPGIVLKVDRPRHIRMRFTDIHNETNTFVFANLTARIVQHEMDHLDGKLFFEGAPRPTLERVVRQSKNRGFDYTSMGLMKYTKGISK